MMCKSSLALAALIAVASGQGQNEQECYAINQESQCATTPGCRWDSSTVDTCGSRSCIGFQTEQSCTQTSGCSWGQGFGCTTLNYDDCNAFFDETSCQGNSTCQWSSIETGFCTEDIVFCFDFSNQSACDGARNSDNSQACRFITRQFTECRAYDACGLQTTENACRAVNGCDWSGFGVGSSDGSCYMGNPPQGAGSQDCLSFSDSEASCTAGPRDGTDPTSSCMWVDENNTSCEEFSACNAPGIADEAACQAAGECTWDSISNTCNACQGGFGCDTGTGTGSGSGFGTGTGSRSCFTFSNRRSCENATESDGSRQCSFLVDSFGTPSGFCTSSACQFGDSGNCSSISGCSYNRAIRTCEEDIPFGSGTGTMPELCSSNFLQSDCENASACVWALQDLGNCVDYSPCYDFSNQALCQRASSSLGCEWSDFENSCGPPTPTQPPPPPNVCWAAIPNNRTDCEIRVRDADDNSTDPRCSYVETSTSFCEIDDPCTLLEQQQCTSQQGCGWIADPGSPLGSCFADNSLSTTPNSNAPVDCSSYLTQSTCTQVEGCRYTTSVSSYCSVWSPCIGDVGQNATICDSTEGCWWQSWGAGPQDGSCEEGERPPSTTAPPTRSPSPPPPPTFFTCPSDKFQCTTGDQCINLDYACDGINDCQDASDEAYAQCPTSSTRYVSPTMRPCTGFEHRCDDGQCVFSIQNSVRCDFNVDCNDGSDEVGCPTQSPTLASMSPTLPEPTPAPSDRPTAAPTVTPECLPRCGVNLNLLLRVQRQPQYNDPGDCRACLGGFDSIEKFCESNPTPPSSSCVSTDTNTDSLNVYFKLPSGASSTDVADSIQNSIIDQVNGLTASSFSGSPNVSCNGDICLAAYLIPSRAEYNIVRTRLQRTSNPLTSNSGGQEIILGSTSRSVGGGGGGGGPGEGDSEPESDNSMIYIVIIIVVVVVVAGILVFVLIRQKRQKAGKMNAKTARQTYMNPQYAEAHSAGPPSWADPNYPFISRQQAEEQLRNRGMMDGDYVIRQAQSTVNGYVITACNNGTFSNSQLKFANGNLTYGGVPVGGNIDEAIVTLQTKIQVAPSSGQPFFLKGGASSTGQVEIDDGEADA